jgi:hypothetical protein
MGSLMLYKNNSLLVSLFCLILTFADIRKRIWFAQSFDSYLSGAFCGQEDSR